VQENFNRDIGVLIALSVGLRIAAFIALLLRTRRKS
jgi:tetrahydromethanopterin S-methyltransferase subunit G